ncbi:hypothetical protein A2U01_0085746, partial [Trifolium medium]|nr:hypothetical protein [Trifolium medium]
RASEAFHPLRQYSLGTSEDDTCSEVSEGSDSEVSEGSDSEVSASFEPLS